MPPSWGRRKFRHYVKRGRDHFVGDGGTIHGRRLRVWGDSVEKVLAKAERLQKEIDEHGQLALTLSSKQRYVAAEIFAIADRLRVDALDVVREYERRHPMGGNARTLDEVRAELIAMKGRRNRRAKYVASLDCTLRGLVEALGDKPVTEVTTLELDQEIDRHEWAPATVHGHVSSWKVLFNYAVARKYAFENPCTAIELPERDQSEPTIFSIEEVRRLFAATLFRDRDPVLPYCQPYLAFGLFAGVRPEEIERLAWEQVDVEAKTVTILGEKSKVRARRMIDLSENLIAWIRPWVRKDGSVLAFPVATLRRACRLALGLARWPHDVMRHSYGSYHFAFHRNEALTRNQMGHTDDGRVFFAHYRKMVGRSVAKLFWAIFPPSGLLPR